MSGVQFIKALGYKRNSREYFNWRGALIAKALARVLTYPYFREQRRHFGHQGKRFTIFTLRVDDMRCGIISQSVMVCHGTLTQFDRKRMVAGERLGRLTELGKTTGLARLMWGYDEERRINIPIPKE